MSGPRAGSNASCFCQSVMKTSCTISSAAAAPTTRAATVKTSAAWRRWSARRARSSPWPSRVTSSPSVATSRESACVVIARSAVSGRDGLLRCLRARTPVPHLAYEGAFPAAPRAHRVERPEPRADGDEVHAGEEHRRRRAAPGTRTPRTRSWAAAATGSGPAPKRSGTLVVASATIMSAINGRAARRVKSPTTSRAPHTISTPPTKEESSRAAWNPIFAKRPGPWLSKRNFMAPETMNTAPTAARRRTVSRGAVGLGSTRAARARGRGVGDGGVIRGFIIRVHVVRAAGFHE